MPAEFDRIIDMERKLDGLAMMISSLSGIAIETASNLRWQSAFASGLGCAQKYGNMKETLRSAEDNLGKLASQVKEMQRHFEEASEHFRKP